MAEHKLLELVAKDRAAGQSDDQIRQKLTQAGWSAEDVNGALALSTLKKQTTQDGSLPGLPSFEELNAPRNKTRWFGDILLLALLVVVLIGLYLLYSSDNQSRLGLQQFLPAPDALGTINPAGFVNVVGTSTATTSSPQ